MLVALSSCREIEPFTPPTEFSGYQINGTVETSGGMPLEGVPIRMFYQFGARVVPEDTARVFISEAADSIRIFVYDSEGRPVRRFDVPDAVGWLPRNIWDERDSTNATVKNGLYTISVSIDGQTVKQYTWLVDGKICATSDANGEFSITNRHLPLGKIANRYDDQGQFFGAYIILSSVHLRASHAGVERIHILQLTRDQITRVRIIF